MARAAPPQRISLALGLVSAGGSFGQFAMPLFSQGLIGGVGWLSALLILAVCAGLMVPFSFGLTRADRARNNFV